MEIGTWLFTMFKGELVGTDATGNRYYREKRPRAGMRVRRWVYYNGAVEASRVPADWHGWLHGRVDDAPPPGGVEKKAWQKDHVVNLTGSSAAYRPPGHVLGKGQRKPATGDYQPWRPS
jgi:NADH:ubiquinone oxidoreductase subunit